MRLTWRLRLWPTWSLHVGLPGPVRPLATDPACPYGSSHRKLQANCREGSRGYALGCRRRQGGPEEGSNPLLQAIISSRPLPRAKALLRGSCRLQLLKLSSRNPSHPHRLRRILAPSNVVLAPRPGAYIRSSQLEKGFIHEGRHSTSLHKDKTVTTDGLNQTKDASRIISREIRQCDNGS